MKDVMILVIGDKKAENAKAIEEFNGPRGDF